MILSRTILRRNKKSLKIIKQNRRNLSLLRGRIQTRHLKLDTTMLTAQNQATSQIAPLVLQKNYLAKKE